MILGICCVLGFFVLAPLIPVSMSSVAPYACGFSCPAMVSEGPVGAVSLSFYFFHVGGTIWFNGYLLWFAPGWTCTQHQDATVCMRDAISL